MRNAIGEVGEIGEFFGDVFGFVETYSSVEATKDAINEIGLRNFFEYDAKGKIVADIGCGYGRATLEMLLAGAASVIAVDVSEKQLERTKHVIEQAGFSNVVYKSTSADKLDIPDGSCDIVVSLGVTHHLPSFTDGLDELCRITKPSGLLFLATIGKKGAIPRARAIIRAATRTVPYDRVRNVLTRLPISKNLKYIIADTLWAKYYHQYSLAQLRRLLRDRGFENVQTGDIYASKSPAYKWLQGEGYIHVMARKADDVG